MSPVDALTGCDNQWDTKGTLTILRHELVRYDAGPTLGNDRGYDATLEAVLRTAEGGWAIDAHFTVSGVCGVDNAP